MKTIVLLVFLFSISAHCYAQVDQQKLLYVKKSEKFRKMKNRGTGLAVVGTILFIAGIVTLSNVTYAYNSSGVATATSGKPEQGALMFLGGVAGLGAGIPLWVVGAHNQRKYEKKYQNLSVRINAAPQNRGLTLTYRF